MATVQLPTVGGLPVGGLALQWRCQVVSTTGNKRVIYINYRWSYINYKNQVASSKGNKWLSSRKDKVIVNVDIMFYQLLVQLESTTGKEWVVYNNYQNELSLLFFFFASVFTISMQHQHNNI